MSAPLSVRIRNASTLLKIPEESLSKLLEDEGITGDNAAILDSPAISLDDLSRLIEKIGDVKPLLVKAAAGMLKDMASTRPVPGKSEDKTGRPVLTEESLYKVFKEVKPIEQWSDRELLEKFSEDRDQNIEQQLNARAKGNAFIVLMPLMPGEYDPGKEKINIDFSLELLKTARRGKVIPSMVPYEDKICPVYRITELNMQDRIVDYCPVCGETLYKGYCEKCALIFSSIGQDERAFIKLITESDSFNPRSYSDRKAVLTAAAKGIDELKLVWPSMAHKFDELKATGNLPTLRTIETRPTTTMADPFHVNGNRVFGNRKY